MGKSSRSKLEEVMEELEPAENDRVFVPHYEDFANTIQQQNSCAPRNTNTKKLYCRPQESPPSVLPPAGSHGHFWPSSGEGSSMSSVDNYDQSASVNLHQRLSEFQVALRASERAREEGQRETDSLRVYVGSVEAAAAGLLSRVQELEHLLAFSSVVKHGHDIDQLRGKVATAATHEVRKHAAAAAQAVAAAREATMELDKVRRETHALTKAQQEEIERLNMEAAECRILHEARGRQNQDLLEQNDKLERQWEEMNAKVDDLQESHKIEYSALQKKYEAVKATARENRAQNAELKKSLEMSRMTARSLQKKLDELVLEQKESVLHHELLEQQVKALQGQEVSSTIAHYDHELRKVRASLGGEKAQLLVELASLRRSNQRLRGEVADWQDRFKMLSQHYSGLEELSQHTEQSSNKKAPSPRAPGGSPRDDIRPAKSESSSRNTTVKGGDCSVGAGTREDEVDAARQAGSGTSSSASVAGPSSSSKGSAGAPPRPGCDLKAGCDTCSRGSSSAPNSTKAVVNQIRAAPAEERSVNAALGADGIFALAGMGPQRPSQCKNIRKAKSPETSGSESSIAATAKAAHRGIVKLKKGEATAWPKNVEPVGVFGPVMMFLACLLALGTPPERA